jgi:hypothetical protein
MVILNRHLVWRVAHLEKVGVGLSHQKKGRAPPPSLCPTIRAPCKELKEQL